jgi:hypothetical protein
MSKRKRSFRHVIPVLAGMRKSRHRCETVTARLRKASILGDAWGQLSTGPLNVSFLELIKKKTRGTDQGGAGGRVLGKVRREGCSRSDPVTTAVVAVGSYRSYCSVP